MTEQRDHRVVINKDLDGGVAASLFEKLVIEEPYQFVRNARWQADPRITDFDKIAADVEWIHQERTFRFKDEEGEELDEAAIYRSGGGVGLLRAEGGSKVLVHCRVDSDGDLYFKVAGGDAAHLKAVIDHYLTLYPQWEPTPANEEGKPIGPVRFWSLTPQGPMNMQRMIDVPEYDTINNNYPPAIAEQLDGIMSWESWPSQGKLMLWHGNPGTGKTFALRSLCWQWREWIKVNYIVDPEAFLSDPTYMMKVLMMGGQADMYDDPMDEGHTKRKKEPWHFLILEDAGELMAEDAKKRTGQGLSRLLNASDGLLGQGLKVCTLITTNEKLDTLHPAIERPGRCASNIEFQPFTVDEGRQWLEDRGVTPNGEVKGSKGVSLAELYAIAENRKVKTGKKERAFGFGS